MILDTTTRSARIVLGEGITTTNPTVCAFWADQTSGSGGFLPADTNTTTNGTTPVTIVAAPGSGVQRAVTEIRAYNADTVPHSFTLQLDDNGTIYVIDKATVGAGGVYTYLPGQPSNTSAPAVLLESGTVGEKISAMPAAAALTGVEPMAGVQSSANVEITGSNLGLLILSGAFTTYPLDATVSGNAGTGLSIKGGAGLTTGKGGAATITAGAGGASGAGGAVSISAADGGSSAGAVTIQSASISAAHSTGAVTIQSGDQSGTNNSGRLNLVSGAVTSGLGGAVTLASGNASTTGTSGSVLVGSGTTNSNTSGAASLTSGASTSGTSGAVTVGTGTGAITGGVTVSTGNASAGNSGAVTLKTGTATGTAGNVIIQPAGVTLVNTAAASGTDTFQVSGTAMATAMRTNGNGGPTWTGGTGAPATSPPQGSLFSRTDGVAGTTLYTTTGSGAWTPVSGSWQKLSTTTISGVTTTGAIVLTSGYQRYQLIAQNVTVATNTATFNMQFSLDGGVTWITTSTYAQMGSSVSAGTVTGYGSATTSIIMTVPLSNAANVVYDGTFDLWPGSASAAAVLRGQASGFGTAWFTGQFAGANITGAAVTAIRIQTSAGNIAGTFILLGLV